MVYRKNGPSQKNKITIMEGSLDPTNKSTDLIQILLNTERNESCFPSDFLKKKRNVVNLIYNF